MILSAAIVDKEGTIYVARQYCEMTRGKVEAIYMAFSRLINRGKQHTIIDTNQVRYVYRSINDFYCVLITDKNSNILEDIKTLNLFTGAMTEYASIGKKLTEESITETRFELLFVLDEILFMGVRQIDNLAQLRAIIEMNSEEEKAFVETLSKKEKEAKAKAAEKSKELDQQRRNEMLHQSERSLSRTGIATGVSSSSKVTEPVVETTEEKPAKPARVMSRGRALKLKPKN